jgi:hypothetical protein
VGANWLLLRESSELAKATTRRRPTGLPSGRGQSVEDILFGFAVAQT